VFNIFTKYQIYLNGANMSSDITSADFQKLIDSHQDGNKLLGKLIKAMGGSAGPSSKGPSRPTAQNTNYRGSVGDNAAMQKLIQNQGKLSGATLTVTESLKRTTNASVMVANKFGSLSSAAGDATNGLSAVAKAFGAGGALMAIAKQLDETTDMYRKVNSYGQSFGGSMLAMHQAAAGAALPLEQFAEAIKNNARVLSTVGTKAFFDLNKQLRNSMTDVGQLGMTTGQLNTFMGNYMETQRMYGNVSGAMTEKSVQSMKLLAIETQKAAESTGANRDELAKATQDALRDITLRAKMSQLSSGGNDAFSQSLQRTTTYLAALPGEAGKRLSEMLAQTVGRGSALMADQTEKFAEAGLLGVTDLMDNLARKVQAGTSTGADVAEFNRRFVSEGMRNMDTLKLQAASGNRAAAEAINMILEAKESLKAPPADLAKQKQITNFMLNFSNMLQNISGYLRGKFFDGLENLMKGFEGFTESAAFKDFQEKIGGMALRLGQFLSEHITPEKLIAIGLGLAAFAEATVKFSTYILSGIELVGGAFGWLSDKIGVLGAAVAVFATYMGGKMLIKQAGSLLAERFTIGGSRQESFSQALNRFAAGNSLRTTSAIPGGRGGPGGAGGPDIDGPDGDNDRNRRNPNEPDNNRRRRRLPEIEGPQEPRGNRIQRRLRQFGDAGQNFRQRAQRTLTQAVRNPGSTLRNAGAGSLRAIRGAPGRIAANRTASRIAGAGQRAGGAVRRVGGAMTRGAGAVARGGMNLARGIGPGALAGVAISGALSMAPDFKGKETLQSMAEFAAMGSMLGPIGAAVGAGVGAVYANWDDLSSVATNAFQAVKDFDYAAPFKAAGDMLSPIGDSAKWLVNSYVDMWKSVGSTMMTSIGSIAKFDYKSMWGDVKGAGAVMMTSIASAFSSIGTSLGGVFNWATNLLKPADGSASLFSSLLKLNPITAVVNDLISPNKNISGPNNPQNTTTPQVNTDAMTTQLAQMKEESSRISKENSELKAQMALLMDNIAKGNASQVGGLRDLIAEQKKSNGNLSTLANNTI
jgi:hypothetical protein